MSPAAATVLQPFDLAGAVAEACAHIAPTWPLDQFIAVNPYWGWTDQGFLDTAASLRRLSGATLFMPPAYYAAKWRQQEIRAGHLAQALDEVMPGTPPADALQWLTRQERPSAQSRLLSDAVDTRRDLDHEPAWRDALTQQISQFCASYFDDLQSDWRPVRDGGLYAAWREGMTHDHSIALLMRRPDIADKARSLPPGAMDLIDLALDRLQVPAERTTGYLTALLLSINGWAAWCAYLRWQARLQGSDNDQIVDLLAIRLAWECLLDDGCRDSPSAWDSWRHGPLFANDRLADERLAATWLRADEIAYQSALLVALSGNQTRPQADAAPEIQAAFCIDVRSEVFRRALERALPSAQTLGFAGFFGLPIRYQPLGTGIDRPQLPGLLWPVLNSRDSTGDEATDTALASRRVTRLQEARSWHRFQRLPASGFTLVESLGLGYLEKLLARSLVTGNEPAPPEVAGLSAAERARLTPQLDTSGLEERARTDLAERVLRAMGLTRIYGRIILLAGHGSQCANNPHRAGLDCGACGGQTGEVNARALATLLNDPAIRAGLVARGLPIPDSTLFVAGLHNTTTDEVTLFDTERVAAASRPALARLREALDRAGDIARAERAPSLDLDDRGGKPEALHKAIRKRALDWAQTRPEWGLAGNAAFVVAPRARTRGLDLHGRSFLHDYDWHGDTDNSILELIMTAPMVVTHWINLQYYASTVDNRHYGSGNKVLHNVVGGRIGVFEGNSGDLRIGLPMQSLHDGRQWMHAPLRLSVFIQAPIERIDAVIRKHEKVRQLLDGQWLHLFQLPDDGGMIQCYRSNEWTPASA